MENALISTKKVKSKDPLPNSSQDRCQEVRFQRRLSEHRGAQGCGKKHLVRGGVASAAITHWAGVVLVLLAVASEIREQLGGFVVAGL